jgi:hypothetical protein
LPTECHSIAAGRHLFAVVRPLRQIKRQLQGSSENEGRLSHAIAKDVLRILLERQLGTAAEAVENVQLLAGSKVGGRD